MLKVYLASPYTKLTSEEKDHVMKILRLTVAESQKRGFAAFSPILYCHELALTHNLPSDYSFWQIFNETWLTWADHLWVLTYPGYKESVGITAEINIARSMEMPVYLVRQSKKGQFLTISPVKFNESINVSITG